MIRPSNKTPTQKQAALPTWASIMELVYRISPRKLLKGDQAYIQSVCSDTKNANSICYQIFFCLCTVANEELRLSPEKYKESDGVGKTFLGNVNHLIKKNIFVKEEHIQRIANLESWFSKQDDLRYGLAKKVILDLKNITIIYKHSTNQFLLESLIKTFKALKRTTNSLTTKLEKINQQYIAIDYSNLIPKNIEKLLDTLKRKDGSSIKNFNELTLSADATIAHHLNASNACNETKDAQMLALSKLANQLIADAERRKTAFPEEHLLAAQIRLAINQQCIAPIERQKFTTNIAPLLEQAHNHFNRHRHHVGLRILVKMLQFISIIGIGVEIYRYAKTGSLFKTHASETVRLMSKAINNPLRKI